MGALLAPSATVAPDLGLLYAAAASLFFTSFIVSFDYINYRESRKERVF